MTKLVHERIRERPALAGLEAIGDQTPQSQGSLRLLITADELAQVLARVAVLTGSDSSVDVLTELGGQGEAHGVPTHRLIVARLSTVVNINALVCPVLI